MATFFFFWRLFFDKNVVPVLGFPRNMDRLALQKLRDDQDLP